MEHLQGEEEAQDTGLPPQDMEEEVVVLLSMSTSRMEAIAEVMEVVWPGVSWPLCSPSELWLLSEAWAWSHSGHFSRPRLSLTEGQ